MLKLSRLIQPRNPLFWLMVVLNLLSSLLSWVLHTRELATAPMLVVALFALSNAVLGIWLAVRLMREPLPGEKT
jgi:4-hydroxybenzoate polyprenyltransferase